MADFILCLVCVEVDWHLMNWWDCARSRKVGYRFFIIMNLCRPQLESLVLIMREGRSDNQGILVANWKCSYCWSIMQLVKFAAKIAWNVNMERPFHNSAIYLSCFEIKYSFIICVTSEPGGTFTARALCIEMQRND